MNGSKVNMPKTVRFILPPVGVALVYQEANISCDARPDIRRNALTNARLQKTVTYRHYAREVDEEIRRLESELIVI